MCVIPQGPETHEMGVEIPSFRCIPSFANCCWMRPLKICFKRNLRCRGLKVLGAVTTLQGLRSRALRHTETSASFQIGL